MTNRLQKKLGKQIARTVTDCQFKNIECHNPTKADLREQLREAVLNTVALAHGKTRREQSGSPR